MKTYFDAWRDRMKHVDSEFKRVAELFMAQGYEVKCADFGTSPLLTFIHVRKDGNSITFCFHEIPYRWDAYIDLIPATRKKGSCRCVATTTEIDQFPSIWVDRVDEMVGAERKGHTDWMININERISDA